MAKKHISNDSFSSPSLLLGLKSSPLNRNYEAYKAVYVARSMNRAAENLSMDQGNLSRLILRLEKDTGTKLFARHRTGVEPTTEGHILFKVLQDMEQIWQSAQKGVYSQNGSLVLRVGAHSSIARTYFPDLLSYFDSGLPHVYFDVEFGRSYEITRKVQAREMEIGIVANPIKSKDLVIKPLTKETIELCALDPSIRNATLLKNPDMIFIGRVLKRLNLRRVIDMADYDVAAVICSQNPHFWTILPSPVRNRFPKLQVVRVLQENIQIKLITYPGSPAVGILGQLQKAYEKTLSNAKT